jgi:hypothetical protein
VQVAVVRVDPRQTRFDDRARGRLAACEHPREFAQRKKREVEGHGIRQD